MEKGKRENTFNKKKDGEIHLHFHSHFPFLSQSLKRNEMRNRREMEEEK
jgi:hypothetical protein